MNDRFQNAILSFAALSRTGKSTHHSSPAFLRNDLRGYIRYDTENVLFARHNADVDVFARNHVRASLQCCSFSLFRLADLAGSTNPSRIHSAMTTADMITVARIGFSAIQLKKRLHTFSTKHQPLSLYQADAVSLLTDTGHHGGIQYKSK